jgi:hypothetical protein
MTMAKNLPAGRFSGCVSKIPTIFICPRNRHTKPISFRAAGLLAAYPASGGDVYYLYRMH